MPFQAYVSIKGRKQGQFKGDSTEATRKDWITVLAYSFDVVSPRDVQTGHASGKRKYKPISFLKQWDAATPQLMEALATNEILESVIFEFEKVGRDGKQYVYQTVKLTNATVAEVEQFTPELSDPAQSKIAFDIYELDRVHIVFQTIDVNNSDGKTSFHDDWQ
jgi:type VI secretion system secreted protein Hcp